MKNIEGYGTVLGYIAFGDTENGSTNSIGWWDVRDANGEFVKRISATEDRRRDGRVFVSDVAVTEDDVLALARTVYPSAVRVFDADMMADAGVIDAFGAGYAILGRA